MSTPLRHSPSLKENTSHLIVSVSDRKHIEAFILSFVAEDLLPQSVDPKLIEFSQFSSRDPKPYLNFE